LRIASRYLLVILFCASFPIAVFARCPARPAPGTIVGDALTLTSTNGVLKVEMVMDRSVDVYGYTHYCYIYQDGPHLVESPTIRVNPGDRLILYLKDDIHGSGAQEMSMPRPADDICGDNGPINVESTNIHFHGMDVSPHCHQDDVINTLIEPNSPPFEYNIPIPSTQPPGLYWYHPHIHGFTEFQVNGGAAGALVVNGIEKYYPELAGLVQRVFTIRQQYLVPWIPGPYQLSINYQVAAFPNSPSPIIEMKPGEKQFWRVANDTIQDFLVLQVLNNSNPQPLEMIGLDGYPLEKTRTQTSILIPPASRAEFVVTAPTSGNPVFMTQAYSTGPTGNPDLEQTLANIRLTNNPQDPNPDGPPLRVPAANPSVGVPPLKYADLSSAPITAKRKLYFSEEFGGTNGPIQFYITLDGQKPHVFEPEEKPIITTKVGAVEEWTIENHALETHAFHIHQIHFKVLEIDGKPAANQDLRDTIEIPFWEGPGTPYHSVKLLMDFRDPTISGTFVFHCHILLHEDLGMMHKILVEPK
jgi:FtsP/CotA-like multicopper oxidase with cupredoxin domain